MASAEASRKRRCSGKVSVRGGINSEASASAAATAALASAGLGVDALTGVGCVEGMPVSAEYLELELKLFVVLVSTIVNSAWKAYARQCRLPVMASFWWSGAEVSHCLSVNTLARRYGSGAQSSVSSTALALALSAASSAASSEMARSCPNSVKSRETFGSCEARSRVGSCCWPMAQTKSHTDAGTSSLFDLRMPKRKSKRTYAEVQQSSSATVCQRTRASGRQNSQVAAVLKLG
eukprot:4737372-Pleurochrysis_carterae.AAC.1